jgi:DNA helicase-2/ATP-dependent DNA helicase PcrA
VAETGIDTPLLPLEDLAARLYQLQVIDDPALDSRVECELNVQLGLIRLRPGLLAPRRRFAIAHALGHRTLEGDLLALHSDEAGTLDERVGAEADGEAGVPRARASRERQEHAANLFALELLIPAAMLRQALEQPGWTVDGLAEQYGVSPDALCAQLANICCADALAEQPAPSPAAAAFAPDIHQQGAVDAPMPTLVVAGPGTGKTRTIVAKYLALVGQGAEPAHILALTFSNKAAEEMRERIAAALAAGRPELAGRVEVSTFHAWGLQFLKRHAATLGLSPELRLLAPADIYILLLRRLEELPLEQYKDLREPGMYLRQIAGAIGRAKDELHGPAEYRRLAEAEAARLLDQAEGQPVGKITKKAQEAREKAARHAARLRELADIYPIYEQILADEGALDYGDLIMRAVVALRQPDVAAAVQRQHHYILVDEFQDINYASGELVRLLDGGRGRVWAVGDPWQSIYRFRGASPANLAQFTQLYQNAETRGLLLNYRSQQQILDVSHTLMAPDPLAEQRPPLQAWRAAEGGGRIAEWAAADADAEASAIAHDILRRVRRGARRRPPCARRPLGRPSRVRRPRRPLRHWRWSDHAVLCRTHAQAQRVAAALAAHGVPIDQPGELLAVPQVQDVLAICAMAGADSPGTLRALTVPEHALPPEDMDTLVRLAHVHKLALPRAARDETIVRLLSASGQRRLHQLHALVDDLAGYDDAWQALARYLFDHSAAARERIRAAAHGSQEAWQALGALGQLLGLARAFVRQAPPQERALGHFVVYLRLLLAAGERIATPVPAAGADRVHVLTVHAAKGLEFPIVYVPGVQEGVFPARKQYGSIPELPALVHGAPADDLQEERYLLYVALTRARDGLIISRAAARDGKPVKRSSLLPGDEHGAGAPWPVRAVDVRGDCPAQAFVPQLAGPPLTRSPIPASSLETYARCPRQYLYQYGFQLYDDLSPYLRMHQTIRDVVHELAQRAQNGTLPPDETALHGVIAQAFDEHGLADVLYQEDYFGETFGHILGIWQALHAGAYAPEDLNQRFVVQRPAGAVGVRVDRVEAGEGGRRWVRARSGREREGDRRSAQLALYAEAQRQAYGEAGEIALHYSATGSYRGATPRPDSLAGQLEQIDQLLEAIAEGHWEPNPGAQCATCAFNLICPV